MSTKSVRPSGSGAGSGSGKPPGAAKWCEYHRVTTHDTFECRAAAKAGVVKLSNAEVKAARKKREDEWLRGIIRQVAAQRASRLAANSSGQAAPPAAYSSGQANPSAANVNVDPQDAAKNLEDPKAAKGVCTMRDFYVRNNLERNPLPDQHQLWPRQAPRRWPSGATSTKPPTSHNTADCNYGMRTGQVKKPVTKEQRIKEGLACRNVGL
ncbi:hypothetical protein KCU65_g1318, partial [Aureobasidium melanogenum]